MKKAQFYINGVWTNGNDTISSINPSTGELFGEIYSADATTVDQAVQAAINALPAWRSKSIDERAKFLARVAELLVEEYGSPGESTPLKALISLEMGKRLPEADIEVIETSDMINYFVNHGNEILSEKNLTLNQELWATKESQIKFQPVGVVGIIKAWNYPLEIPCWSIAPALIAGNTVVFKPSEYGTFVAQYLVKLFEKAGLPPGVLNLITGDGEAGKQLVQHTGINMVSFTGSLQVGTEIGLSCTKRHIRYALELGGNDAAIVARDADIELTANGLVWGAFCNSGQVCTGIKRAFINESIGEKLIEKVVNNTKNLRRDIDFGPIVNEKQLDVIDGFVMDAISKGATLLTGGARIKTAGGYYYEPTVLTEVTQDMRVMNEECFGPLLPITYVKDDEEAINLSNSSVYGLGASVWSTDNIKAQKIALELNAGMVWINDVNVALPEAPWTATKHSGNGIDLSEFSFYEYVTVKHINRDLSQDKSRVWWYPYPYPS